MRAVADLKLVSADQVAGWYNAHDANIRTVRTPDGRIFSQTYRTVRGIVVVFPGFARFRLSSGGIIEGCAEPDAQAAVIHHLFDSQIVPMAWSREGSLALHSGAISTPAGAIAILGESGRGKSTLCMYLASRGYPLLTDDTLLLERVGESFLALPGPEEIRLWDDSSKVLLGEDAPRLPSFDYTQKGQYRAIDFVDRSTAAAPLRRLFILGAGETKEVVVVRTRGTDALFAVTNSSFLLDHLDPDALSAYFENVASLCKSVEVYSLDFPRRYDVLLEVKDAITG